MCNYNKAIFVDGYYIFIITRVYVKMNVKWILVPFVLMILLGNFLVNGELATNTAENGTRGESNGAYMFRGNSHRTGVYESETPDNNSLLWSFDTGTQIESSPVVMDDKVYFGSDNGRIYCVNISTGDEVWNFTTGNAVKSTPTVLDGIVYVGSTDGNLYAINTETGLKRWNYTLPNPFAQIVSSPALINDKIFFGASDGNLYALNATTQALEWAYPIGGDVQSSPAVDWPLVYIGSQNGRVCCVWANNGTERWVFESEENFEIYSTPAISGGAIFIGAGWYMYGGTFYCLDALTGEELWTFYPPGEGIFSEIYSSPAIHDGTVFIHAWNKTSIGPRGVIYALPESDPNGDGNITHNEIKWSFTTYDNEGGSSPGVADGKVLVGSTDGKMYCIDESTGKELWNLTTGLEIVSSPTIADGVVYICSRDGSIYAVGGDTELANIEIQVIPESESLKAGRVMGISFQVTYRGSPVEGAFINVDVTSGTLWQKGASTFPDGTQRIKYTAPMVDENTTITIQATVTKVGYPDAQSSAQFSVEPASSYDKASESISFSFSRYWTYIIIIGVLILINVMILILGVRRKDKIGSNRKGIKEDSRE